MYVHIRYAPFVALEIFGGVSMDFVRFIRLFSECYKIAGFDGVKACVKYLCGALILDDPGLKSSDFSLGGSDA